MDNDGYLEAEEVTLQEEAAETKLNKRKDEDWQIPDYLDEMTKV